MRTNSCTSLSSPFALAAIAAAVVASASFSFFAKTHWHLGNRYWGAALRISARRAEELEKRGVPKTVVFGGSTVRTSYIPSALEEEFGVHCVNMGLNAGFGADVLSELAMRFAKPGDTVVVALEPDLLSADGNSLPTTSGIDFLLFEDGLPPRRHSFVDMSPLHFAGWFQCQTRYVLFMAMKALRRMKPYRYTAEENLRGDGWMEVRERRSLPFSTNEVLASRAGPGAAGRSLLLALRDECARRGCRAVYQLPPKLDGNPAAARASAAFLLEISSIMPCVKDPMLGVNPRPEEFADTDRHPLRSGALRATRSFGEAIANGRFWSEDELKALAAGAP